MRRHKYQQTGLKGCTPFLPFWLRGREKRSISINSEVSFSRDSGRRNSKKKKKDLSQKQKNKKDEKNFAVTPLQ